MQSPACVAGNGSDTTGTFDAKCIEHRRVMRLTSPSMEAHAAGRPRLVIGGLCGGRPSALRFHPRGFASGRRTVYGRLTAGVS